MCYAALLNNLAGTYQLKGDLDKTLEYYLKSKSIRDNLGLQNTSGYAALMTNMAGLYYTNGDRTQAGKYYRKAYKIYSKLGSQKNADTMLEWAEKMENQ